MNVFIVDIVNVRKNMKEFISFEEYLKLNTIQSVGFQMIFNRKYYEKYDIFKFGNSHFMCVNNPKRIEKGWVYEIFPINSGLEYNKNNIYPTYYTSFWLPDNIKESYKISKKLFDYFKEHD